MRLGGLVVIAGLLLPLRALAGECAEDLEPLRQDARVRDSAGVVIVESPRSAFESRLPWTFGAVPLFAFGAGDETVPEPFGSISNSFRLPDRRVVVVVGRPAGILVFRPDGRFDQGIGGAGEGPGEWRAVTSVWAADDGSIVVFDEVSKALHVYASDGVFRHRTALQVGNGVLPDQAARGPTGGAVVRLSPGVRLESRPFAWTLVHVDEKGVKAGEFARREWGGFVVDERRVDFVGPPLFTQTLVWSRSPRGVVVNTSAAFRLDEIAPGGRLLRSIRVDAPAILVSPAIVQRYFEDWEGRGGGNAARESIAKVGTADSIPLVGKLLTDDVGFFWAAEYNVHRPATPVRRWWVVDPTRGVLGFMDMPEQHEVLAIGRDEIFFRVRNENGVPRLVVLPLLRR